MAAVDLQVAPAGASSSGQRPRRGRYRARYRRILFFFARLLLSLTCWELLLPRLGLRNLVRRTREERLRRHAASYRSLAIEMGGVLIKVGQFLSSRVDVLPPMITQELAGLQDEVPAEDFNAMRRLVEAELGGALEEKFAWFEPHPWAAASLGQVHLARIYCAPQGDTPQENPDVQAGPDLCEVVVKIQRPEIEQILEVDLAAFHRVGGWLQHYPPLRRRADVPALMDEFSRILYAEIDYLAEGQNAETFARNFQDDDNVRVPRVFWTHTTRRVLTLEDVRAIKITDYDAITAAGIERGEVARRLMSTYLKQIFEDGFFHADPHPGNLFVRGNLTPGPFPVREGGRAEGSVLDLPVERGKSNASWQLTFVDFGMVGRVPPQMLQGMREMIVGVGTRDAARVVRSTQMLGVLLPGADLSLLEKAEAEAFDRFWGKSMSELQSINVHEMIEFAGQFRELIYTLPFQIPQDLILLGRAVGILSGMCTGLDPDFNVWEGITPFARKLIAEEMGAGGRDWWEAFVGIARRLVNLPLRLDTVLAKAERGELAVRDPQLARQVQRLERAVTKATGGVIFAALLLGGVQLFIVGQVGLGIALLVGAGLALGYVLFSPGISNRQ